LPIAPVDGRIKTLPDTTSSWGDDKLRSGNRHNVEQLSNHPKVPTKIKRVIREITHDQ
jgi:thioredoxin reductase